MKSRRAIGDTAKFIKVDDRLRVGGYLVRFTDKDNPDLQGEFFDKDTNFWLESNPIKGKPIFIDHTFDTKMGAVPIGILDFIKEDSVGIWVEGKLKERKEYEEMLEKWNQKGYVKLSSFDVSKLAKNLDLAVKTFFGTGKAQWSSGALPQSVEISDVEGSDSKHIDSWMFIEGTGVMTPAEPNGTQIGLKQAFIELDKIFTDIQLSAPRKDASNGHKDAKADDSNTIDNSDNEETKMNEELMAVLEGIQSQLSEIAAGMGASDPDKAADEVIDEIKADDNIEDMPEDEEEAAKSLMTKAFEMLKGKIEAEKKVAGTAKKALNAQAKAYARNQKGDTGNLGGFSTDDPNKAKSSTYEMPHVQIGKTALPNIGTVLQELYAYKTLGTEMKSQSYQLGSSGGFLLDHAVSNEFIEILRDKLILTQLGADFIPMDGQETLTLPKDDTEHTAYWVGEGTEIPDSQETVGGIVLYPKPLAARVIVPNKFLANSRINYQSRIEEKVRYRIDRALEYAALFGAGGKTGSNTGVEPAGITTIADIAGRITKTELGSGNGLKPKLSDIEDMIGRVEDANVVDDGSFGFAISPKAKRYFGNMKDADGNYILRARASDSIDQNFLSYSYADSNLIPNNQTVGTNSDNTTLFFGNWNDLKIGMSNNVEFFIDPYTRSKHLETVIIAHIYADVNIARDEAFEVVTGARV